MNTRLYGPIFLIALAHFCVDVMIGIWPIYKTMAGLDLALAGLISGFGALIGEGMQAVFGHLSDQGHRKKLIIGGVFISMTSILLAFTTNYWILFLFFLMTCLGSGAFHPAAASFAAGLNPARKGTMVALFASGGLFGLAFSQLIFSSSFYAFEGNLLWLMLPIMLLIGALTTLSFSAKPLSGSGSKKSLFAYIEFLKERDLRNLYILQVCNQSVFWGLIFLLPDILKEREYDPWLSLGGGHMCLVLGGACMLIPSGLLADRYSCKQVLLVATLIASFSFYAMVMMPFLSPLPLAVLLFVLGGSLGTVNPVGIAFANQLKPNNPGAVSALMMGLVWCVAEGIGQTGGGLLTKFFEEEAAAKALSIVGFLMLFGFFAARLLPSKVYTTAPVDAS